MPTTPPRRPPGHRSSDAAIVRAGIGFLGVLLVGGIVLVGGSFLFGGGDPASERPAARRPSALPTSALTSSGGPGPSSSPSAAESATKKPTTATMRTFVRDYLATVTANPSGGWARLTPAFRRSSGGFASYQRFWGGISRAEARNVEPDPAALTVGYDVDYTHRDGSHSSDSTRLTLTFEHGRYLIAGEG